MRSSFSRALSVLSIKVESLSYTMEDLIFRWELEQPLIVENTFELPQRESSHRRTG